MLRNFKRNKDLKTLGAFFQTLGNRNEKLGHFEEGQTRVIDKKFAVFYPGIYYFDNYRLSNERKENLNDVNSNNQVAIIINDK